MEKTNWAVNLNYSTDKVHYPVLKKCSKIKALGSRHSFNTIADSTENQVLLNQLNQVNSLDTGTHTVSIEGGMRYGELAPYFHENGYALHNLVTLPPYSGTRSLLHGYP